MAQHIGMELVDMAITKGQLKAIVKECLVEILAEGMGAGTATAINEAVKKKPTTKPEPTVSSVMRQNASRVKMQSAAPAQSAAIKEAIRQNAGNNDIMAAILADTAEKTLPTMIENDGARMTRPTPTGAAERLVASYEPEQLFGEEAASKWASLAFVGLPNEE